MAGPTPISALIHAATMVAAGVYVVARLFPLFAAVAGDAGRARRDGRDHDAARRARRRSPRTTSSGCWPGRPVSQLGYMTGALAVGAPAAALFHLLTHAAFKALLFLAAGAVIHAVGTNLHVRHGRPAPAHAGHLLDHDDRPRRAGRAAAARRLLQQGGRPRRRRPRAPTGGGRPVGRLAGPGRRRCSTSASPPAYATRLLAAARSSARAAARPDGPDRATSRSAPADALAAASLLGRCRRAARLLVLAVPAALLGLAASTRLGPPDLEASHLGRRARLPLVLLGARRRRGVVAGGGAPRPTRPRPLGRLGRCFASARSTSTPCRTALVVRPVRALARAVRPPTTRVVDGAVDGTGAGAARLGARLAAAHQAGNVPALPHRPARRRGRCSASLAASVVRRR